MADESQREANVRRLIDLMERTSRQIRAPFPETWPEVELTMPQLRTLVLLGGGPYRMGSIAEHLGSSVSATTAMIDRLVDKGLVRRSHDTRDRRVVFCELSASGKRVIDQIWRIRRERVEHIVTTLTDQDLMTVIQAMEILANASEPIIQAGEKIELNLASE